MMQIIFYAIQTLPLILTFGETTQTKNYQTVEYRGFSIWLIQVNIFSWNKFSDKLYIAFLWCYISQKLINIISEFELYIEYPAIWVVMKKKWFLVMGKILDS